MKNLSRAVLALALFASAPVLAKGVTLEGQLNAANEQLAEQDWAGAAGHFETAYKASNDPKYLLQAAANYSKAGDHTRSAYAYQEYLDKVPGPNSEVRTALEQEKKAPNTPPPALPNAPARTHAANRKLTAAKH